MSSRTAVRVGSQVPTLLHRPSDRHRNVADDLLELADIAGLDPDPWQSEAIREASWLRKPQRRNAKPKWSAMEAVIDVPRQNGKGDVKMIRQLGGLFLFGERLQVHTAHEFKTTYEHFRKLVDVIENVPDFTRLLHPRTGIRTGAGDQAIELRTGQRIRFVARSRKSGRGMSGDTVYLDEAFQVDAKMIGALLYTLRARPNPQLWYTSSAAHLDSVVLHSLRARALAGDEPRLLYMGWNNPPDVDPGDRDAWYRVNPTLGGRVDEETMANEYRNALSNPELMDEFMREALGVPEGVHGYAVIPFECWEAVQYHDAAPTGQLTLAADVNPERTAGAVAVAGGGVVELIEHRPGVGWMADLLVEVAKRHRARVAIDRGSPAGVLIDDLKSRRVDVVPLEMAKACGAFYDDVTGRALRVRRHPDLDASLAGARKRAVGDAWAWTRKDSTADISPLVAATGAHWASTRTPPPQSGLFLAVT